MEFISPGSPLYKFYALTEEKQWSRFERLLHYGEIYLAKPSDFNDPFDCAPYFHPSAVLDPKNVLKLHNNAGIRQGHSRAERRRRARKFMSLSTEVKVEKYRAIGLRHVQNVGIFCMSEKRNHPLMWSHYADRHTGICVQFSSSKGPFQLASKVLYSDQFPTYDLRGNNIEQYARIFLTKAAFWSYESEYRLIAMKIDSEKRMDLLKGFESDHDLMSFAARTATHGIHKISSTLIESITFGCACSDSTIERVIDAAHRHGLHVPFYRAKKKTDKFELSFVDVRA